MVEGPPGTGKSHTIVAIAADCAFRKKSCLVLSDKAEALEVVHNKLSAAMNDVRGTDDFPNPLLRLGTEHANFRRLTSATTITQVAAQVKATKANRSHLEGDRDHRRQALREQIGSVVTAYGAIKTQDILDLERLAMQIDTLCGEGLSAVLDQMCELTPTVAKGTVRRIHPSIEALLSDILSASTNRSRASMDALLATYRFASDISGQIRGSCFQDCPSLSPAQLEQLTEVIREGRGIKEALDRLAAEPWQVACVGRQVPGNLHVSHGHRISSRPRDAQGCGHCRSPARGHDLQQSQSIDPICKCLFSPRQNDFPGGGFGGAIPLCSRPQ